MATVAVATTESSYKSFMKPVKFWQKSSTCRQQYTKKEQQQPGTYDEPISSKDYSSTIQDEKQQEEVVNSNKRSSAYTLSFSLSNSNKINKIPVLIEFGKTQVYKLSTINDAGTYIPPSPTLQGKRDHWIDVKEEYMNFRLPASSACLTTHDKTKQHDFFTPSTFVQTQSYIFSVSMSDSTLSTVPSLKEDVSLDGIMSSRSTASDL